MNSGAPDASTFIESFVKKLTGLIDVSQIWTQLNQTAVSYLTSWVTTTVVKAIGDWLAPFLLGPLGGAWNLLKLVYKGVSWAIDKGKQILCVVQKVFGLFKDALKNGASWVKTEVLKILGKAVQVALSLIAKLLPGDPIAKAKELLMNLRTAVQDFIRSTIKSILKRDDVQKMGKQCMMKMRPQKSGGTRPILPRPCRWRCRGGWHASRLRGTRPPTPQPRSPQLPWPGLPRLRPAK